MKIVAFTLGFFLLLISIDSSNGLDFGNLNVCEGGTVESYSVRYQQMYTTNCGGFFPLTCSRLRTAYRVEYRHASGTLRCCEGWQEENGHCLRPICDPPCQSGGTCIAPNVCICPSILTGGTCTQASDDCPDPGVPSNGMRFPAPGSTGYRAGDVISFSCNPGYILSGSLSSSCDDGVWSNVQPTCQDVDECTFNNGGCDGNCTNTDGSFYCSCPTGDTLNEDGRRCDGDTDIVETTVANNGIKGKFEEDDEVQDDFSIVPVAIAIATVGVIVIIIVIVLYQKCGRRNKVINNRGSRDVPLANMNISHATNRGIDSAISANYTTGAVQSRYTETQVNDRYAVTSTQRSVNSQLPDVEVHSFPTVLPPPPYVPQDCQLFSMYGKPPAYSEVDDVAEARYTCKTVDLKDTEKSRLE
ncbi:uncharacterized protein [Ptychodera flava]|uniref:uncharacterized protein n=1 Tax=Ptychodera flava TaxID=63121 RepID=UPI00396A8EAB